jgi:DNA-binding FadR family transcriptional regulator
MLHDERKSPMSLAAAPRLSLVQTATAALRAEIESRRWIIGDRIPPEPKLAELLQVSRGTVREAVRALSFAGILDVRQGDGTYVRAAVDHAEVLRRLTHAELHHHLEVRCMLEVEAARLAARRRSTDDLAQLRRLLAARRERSPGEDAVQAFVERDLAFHSAVADAAHNPALREMYRLFADTIRADLPATLGNSDLPEPDDAAHEAIVAAIAAGDEEAAEKAARNIIAPMLAALERLPAAQAVR